MNFNHLKCIKVCCVETKPISLTLSLFTAVLLTDFKAACFYLLRCLHTQLVKSEEGVWSCVLHMITVLSSADGEFEQQLTSGSDLTPIYGGT